MGQGARQRRAPPQMVSGHTPHARRSIKVRLWMESHGLPLLNGAKTGSMAHRRVGDRGLRMSGGRLSQGRGGGTHAAHHMFHLSRPNRPMTRSRASINPIEGWSKLPRGQPRARHGWEGPRDGLGVGPPTDPLPSRGRSTWRGHQGRDGSASAQGGRSGTGRARSRCGHGCSMRDVDLGILVGFVCVWRGSVHCTSAHLLFSLKGCLYCFVSLLKIDR